MTLVPCRKASPSVSVDEDGVALCPACGWLDRSPIGLVQGDDARRKGHVRPHEPLSVLIPVHDKASGWRHYLDEKPVFCSTALELRWWTGREVVWLPCRYEGTLCVDPPEAWIYVTLPTANGAEVYAQIRYVRELAVRWPIQNRGDQELIRPYVDPTACRSCGSRRKPCTCG